MASLKSKAKHRMSMPGGHQYQIAAPITATAGEFAPPAKADKQPKFKPVYAGRTYKTVGQMRHTDFHGKR